VSELNASKRLMGLVFEAVSEALNTLRAGQTLVPFIMTLTKEGFILRRFSDASFKAGIERAKQALVNEDEDTLAYVLVYDSVLEIDDTEYDAIMLESGERAKGQGWRFVQRYRSFGENLVQAIGDLAFLEMIDSYLN
jgi:hypothetical protein